MPDLRDGESVEMKGSGAKPYVLKNTGGVFSCLPMKGRSSVREPKEVS